MATTIQSASEAGDLTKPARYVGKQVMQLSVVSILLSTVALICAISGQEILSWGVLGYALLWSCSTSDHITLLIYCTKRTTKEDSPLFLKISFTCGAFITTALWLLSYSLHPLWCLFKNPALFGRISSQSRQVCCKKN
jgi:hypothetical protein